MALRIPLSFISAILMYSAAVFIVFTAIYGYVDFEKNFEIPSKKDDVARVGWDQIMYHSFMVQCASMPDSFPMTRTGRTIAAMHSFLAWIPLLLLIAPWTAVQHKVPILS
jgi:hypothetical protein